MLELSNPSALYLGVVDHVSSMTSGALVCLLVWVGVKVKRNSGALLSFWFSFGSGAIAACPCDRGWPALGKSMSNPAWELDAPGYGEGKS